MRGAVYGAAVTVAKPAKVAEKVVDLARDAQKTEKKVEKALERRAQNQNDKTFTTERAARREAMRQSGAQVSLPNSYQRVSNPDKNPNLRGPNDEKSEFLIFKDLGGNTVKLDHHKWGHIFKDNGTHEKSHYHNSTGGHISYD